MDPRLALKLRSSFLSPLGTLIMCCIYFTLVCYYSVSFLFMVTKYLTVFSISGNMGPSLNYAFLPLIAVGSQSLWVVIPNVPHNQLSSACFWNVETDCRTPTESTMPSSPENMKDAISQPPLITAGVASQAPS